jgi:hypothetical protein
MPLLVIIVTSVIIDDFHVVSTPGAKPETEAPLSIDSETPVIPAITRQLFKAVSRWGFQEVDCCRAMEQNQLALSLGTE